MIMGIMACGKSRIGERIASDNGAIFIEGDDWHSEGNLAKMRAGTPLTDDDRMPWLDRLAAEVARAAKSGSRVVFSCSALKRTYRDRLRLALPDLNVICLVLDAETASQRSGARADHFMPTELIDSQLATLELPADEPRTVTVDATRGFEQVLSDTARALRTLERANVD
jgi:gluconokinase